jgi:hypothetical protein
MRIGRGKGMTLMAVTLVMIATVVAFVVRAAERRRGDTWLQAQTPCVRLKVWDKFDVVGPYQVTFEVTEPDGTKSVATERSVPENWNEGLAYFPYDFHHVGNGRHHRPDMRPGKYHWTARVRHQMIADGYFRVSGSGQATVIRYSYERVPECDQEG